MSTEILDTISGGTAGRGLLCIFCKKLYSIKCHFKTYTKLLLKITYAFALVFLESTGTNSTAYVKKTIIVQLISGLLLFHLIDYSVSAQTEDPSEDEQQGDILDFAGLTTSIGPEPSKETTSGQVPNSETEEIELTPVDFSPIKESAATAREAIQNNDPITAYNALNSAENFLFGVSNKITPNSGEMNLTEATQQLQSLQRHIDASRDALVNRDNLKTMEEVNSLDIELFNFTSSLEDEDED